MKLRLTRFALAATLSFSALPALAANEVDPLALESAPAAAQPPAAQPLRLFLEGTAGRINQRYGQPDLDSHRLSLDLNWSTRLSGGWRVAVSNRLDDIHPVEAGSRATLNSLREAYASWQDEAGLHVVEFGRINLRNGPAYGFNPTDYFRDGTLRAVTTVDPFALRENRLGTVVARYQRLWAGGSVSLALAPKLTDDGPSDKGLSLDLGATNRHNRALATWSTQFSDKLSGQLLAYGEQGKGTQIGASMTALLSDAAVGHIEFSRGRDNDLFAAQVLGAARQTTRNRLSTGATYTTASRLALTLEYEYNGFAPDRAAWDAAVPAGLPAFGRFLLASQARQDNASRSAWLLYASQKSAMLKNLDLTGLLRVNAEDHSRLAWVELRYHWPKFDAALQWQTATGRPASEFGLVPYRQSLQLLGAWYF